MALIRDPNWTGPGPGPLIDDGTGPAPGTPGGGGGGRGQFTVEQAAAIDAAAQQAGGIFQEKHRTILIDWRLVLKVVLLIRKMR